MFNEARIKALEEKVELLTKLANYEQDFDKRVMDMLTSQHESNKAQVEINDTIHKIVESQKNLIQNLTERVAVLEKKLADSTKDEEVDRMYIYGPN